MKQHQNHQNQQQNQLKETKRKISQLKLCEELLNKIENEEKIINERIFRDFHF